MGSTKTAKAALLEQKRPSGVITSAITEPVCQAISNM